MLNSKYKNLKFAKIIATSFHYRTVRLDTVLCGYPPVYTLHSQNFTNNEDIKKLLLFNIQKENECKPGIPVDLIIVNNDVGNKEGNKFIDELANLRLSNGKIFVIQNNNVGWSYGAYNKAFQVFRNKYDYFLFTEDDMIISKDDYAIIGIKHFERTHKCGFVSYLGITKGHEELSLEDSIHAHGASGLSSNEILNKVVEKYGSLPHSKFSDKNKYEDIIIEGEIKFTNCIHKLGYQLIEIDKQKLFEPAFDLMRNIYKPWKPNLFIKFLWLFKKKFRKLIYNLLLEIGMYKIYSNYKKKIFRL